MRKSFIRFAGALVMMTIPFFVMAAGLAAIWAGKRNLALMCWAAGALVILALFRYHTTSDLGLGL